MEEKICTHKSTDCELESIDTLEKYYSVEFSLNSKGPAYIFRLRDISLNCPSILVKEDSSVLKQLKVGDILNMEYNSPESLVPTKLLKTQIISKNSHDRFTGHSLVGLSIIDKQDGRLWFLENQNKEISTLFHYIADQLAVQNKTGSKGQAMSKNSLKEIRESLMISKTELARKANISPITITRIEQDKPCRTETKRKIVLALGLKISDKNKVFGEAMELSIKDKGDRRSGVDRRKFSYAVHIPEHRSVKERRNGLDRRLKSRTSK